MPTRCTIVVLALLLGSCLPAVAAQSYAELIGNLIAPAKLATLGPRGANPRVQKAVYWLAEARQAGQKPTDVLDAALKETGMTKAQSKLTRTGLLRNLEIADKLGCLEPAGLEEMRRGRAPTVRRGPYKGQELSVDHIIPRSVCPELDCVIANLELLPLRVNESKNAKITGRQKSLAKLLYKAGMLSEAGLHAVMRR